MIKRAAIIMAILMVMQLTFLMPQISIPAEAAQGDDCNINSAGYCIFTGSPHQTGLQSGTINITDGQGNFLFLVNQSVAADSTGAIYQAGGRPAFDGDELIQHSQDGLSDDEKAFHTVMAVMYPIRNALMYDIASLTQSEWDVLVTQLEIRDIKDTTYTGGPTPPDNYYGRQGVFNLAKDPDGKDITHEVMKFLEEGSIYLLCHVTSDEFNQALHDNHPAGHDPCDDADMTTKIPFDLDDDGVADSLDTCLGFDDNIDVDNDGIADGCDPQIGSDGCMDSNATNFDVNATVDDGSCVYPPPPVDGCMDSNATNFDANATVDDGSCEYPPPLVEGCMNSTATNFDANATVDDGSCEYPPIPVEGCMNSTATNFDASATVDNGSCVYPPPPISGCMYPSATNFDVNATVDDGSCLFPEPTTENHTNVTNNTSIVEEEGDSEVQDSAGLSSSMMTYGLIAASISLLVILVIIAGTMFLRQRSRAQMFSEFINEDKDNY